MAEISPNQNELPISIDIDAAEAAAQAASDASIEALRKAALAEAAAKGKPAPAEPEDETVVIDEEGAPGDEETPPVVTVDEGLEKLKQQLAESQAARNAAERRANEAAQSEARALSEVQENQLAMITNAIASLTQAQDTLKVRFREARAAGDADAEFDIRVEESKNSARLVQLEAGKQRLENTPKPQPRAQADPVAQFTSTLTPESAAWVRAHPEFVRDPDKNRQMIAAHELAVTRGATVDTPAYFAAIEKTLEIGPKQEDNPMKEAAKPAATKTEPPARKAAPAAAPVSRSGNGAGERSDVVHLSSDEREIARLNKMTDAEYAKAKLQLKREKRLN